MSDHSNWHVAYPIHDSCWIHIRILDNFVFTNFNTASNGGVFPSIGRENCRA